MANSSVRGSGVEAIVQVTLINGGGKNPARVYGSISAENSKTGDKSDIFNKSQGKDSVAVIPGQPIPLAKPNNSVPLDSSLIVQASLFGYDTASTDDQIANGTVTFPAKTSGQSTEQPIAGKDGEIKVKVTWQS